MKVAVDITFGRDRDQQMIRLGLDSHDAYACLSPTGRHNSNLLRRFSSFGYARRRIGGVAWSGSALVLVIVLVPVLVVFVLVVFVLVLVVVAIMAMTVTALAGIAVLIVTR